MTILCILFPLVRVDDKAKWRKSSQLQALASPGLNRLELCRECERPAGGGPGICQSKTVDWAPWKSV